MGMPLPGGLFCCCGSSSSSSPPPSSSPPSISSSPPSSSDPSTSSSPPSTSSSPPSSSSSYTPPFNDCNCASSPGTPGDFNGQTFLNDCRRDSNGDPCTGGYCLSTWTEPDPIGNPGVGSWILTTDRCSRA